MMSTLDWNLDPEVEFDSAGPLGTIQIGQLPEVITAECIILDSFLESLIEGLKILEFEDRAEVEVYTEPEKLTLVKNGNLVIICYAGQKTTINHAHLRADLRIAVKDLLDLTDKDRRDRGQPLYDQAILREFIAQ